MEISVNNAVKVKVSSGYVDLAVSLASLNLADALKGTLKGETKFLARSNDTLRQLTELKRLSDKLAATLPSDKANDSYTKLDNKTPLEPKEVRCIRYNMGVKRGASETTYVYSPPSPRPMAYLSSETLYATKRSKYDDAKAELVAAASKMGFGVQVNTFNEVQTLLRSIDGYLNLQNNEQSASMTRIQGQKDGVNTSIQQTAKNYSESNAAARKLI